jgi:predicted outer membrane repeat protein
VQSGFTGNRASDDGGAVATASTLGLTSITMSANRAGHDGGGLFVLSGNVTLNTTDIFGNRAGTTGGGIRRAGGNVSFLNTSLVELNFPNNCSGLICPF